MTNGEAMAVMYALGDATGLSTSALVQAIKVIANYDEAKAEIERTCPDCGTLDCDKNH